MRLDNVGVGAEWAVLRGSYIGAGGGHEGGGERAASVTRGGDAGSGASEGGPKTVRSGGLHGGLNGV